jgi:hypothetical protein
MNENLSQDNLNHFLKSLPKNTTNVVLQNVNIDKIPLFLFTFPLISLDVSNNKITTIPNLPKTLKHLNVKNNHLKKVNTIGDLEIIDISENKINGSQLLSHLIGNKKLKYINYNQTLINDYSKQMIKRHLQITRALNHI